MRAHATGPASVDEVWDRYTTPARWPGWAPHIRSVEHDGERIAPGSSGIVRGPLGVRVRFVIDDVDDVARTWAWTVRVGPLRVPMRHGVEVDGTGTGAWAEVDGPAVLRVLTLLYRPVARVATRRLVAAD